MIYIKWNNLNDQTQCDLMQMANEVVEEEQGKELMEHCETHDTDYDQIVLEKAFMKLHTFSFVFNM